MSDILYAIGGVLIAYGVWCWAKDRNNRR